VVPVPAVSIATIIIIIIIIIITSNDYWCVSLTEQSICQSEYFRAKCSGIDEVLLMTRALYGRMHISKCVKENFGFIGCSTDVLELVDAQCSGRRECSIRILDENFGNAKPCHDDLKTYLQVNYRCVKGERLSRKSVFIFSYFFRQFCLSKVKLTRLDTLVMGQFLLAYADCRVVSFCHIVPDCRLPNNFGTFRCYDGCIITTAWQTKPTAISYTFEIQRCHQLSDIGIIHKLSLLLSLILLLFLLLCCFC